MVSEEGTPGQRETKRVRHRPAHPLGPRVVLAVPDLPAAAGRPARRPAPPARGRSRPTPTSCSTGRWRWSTTTSRCAQRPRSGCAPWPPPAAWRWGPGTRCRTSSSCPARRWCATSSAACAWRRASAARWTSATSPTCSATSPRCPSSSGCSGSSTPSCGGACPSAIDRSGFWWSAPDGSTVRAEYLPQGYGNGALVPDDAKALVRRIDEFAEEQGDLLVGPILWMNGTDHLMPQPWLGRVVAEANALDAGYELHICSLAEHVHGAPTDGLPVVDRRAPLRRTRQPPDGRGLEPRRREAGGRRRRAVPRTAGRAPVRTVPPAGELARRAARRGLARGDPQQRPRLDLRLLGGRGVRRRAPPLRRGDGRSPRASPTGPCRPSAPPSASDGRVPVLVNPSARTPWRHGGDPPARHRRATRLPARVGATRRARAHGRHRGRGGDGDGGRARVRAEHPRLHHRRRPTARSCSASSARTRAPW